MMAKIFVIDNTLSIRRLMKDILEREGYEVESFATAEEALHEIEKNEPDLVMVDLRLPSMDGITFIKTLEENGFIFPIVVVSDITSPEAITEAFRHGICDFISKPFSPEEIGSAVERCIKNDESLQKRAREIERMLEKSDFRRALKHISKLFSDFPNSAYPHFLYALDLKESRRGEAIRHLKAALALEPGFMRAKNELEKLENSGDGEK
jgi:DNA-binding NtrC family response regulator